MIPALTKKHLLIGAALVLAGVGGFFAYLEFAFPRVRCEAAKHLTMPEELSDCLACHTKVTPVLAQDWQESKHGALLVKCSVCHGLPDGTGSTPFAAKPNPKEICVRCHEPGINRMVDKFGELQPCETCHPRHQNPMHRNAFEAATASGKTEF